ncbi:MAG: hypothetical protein C0410_09720 [Anaerolinea sp.]|nr:hypothetical protein [Anaerolinea sp.]
MINWTFAKFTDSLPFRTAQLLERFFSYQEIEEYQKFKIQKRQTEWFASRLAVKKLVQQVMAAKTVFPLASITIHKKNSGLPYIVVEGLGRVGWLSMSHSQHGVLAAFSQDDSLHFGVDLEFIEPRSLDLFVDYFTTSEITWISNSDLHNKDLNANLVWSAKEAYLKAIGLGLHMDTRKINIHPFGEKLSPKGWNAINFSVEAINLLNWQILFSHYQEYVLTICLPESQRSQLNEVTMVTLIE